MKIIVTGCAGFIGYHLSKALLKLQHTVIGIDNLNNYYDVQLKMSRLDELRIFENFTFEKLDIRDKNDLKKYLRSHSDATSLIHLAAQAGVRYSLENPKTYINNNVLGQTLLYETIKNEIPNIAHIISSSSSSVYGGNDKIPFSVTDEINKPLSIYAASKAAGELISHSYHHLYQLPISTVRFFTVYGPYGRPDMTPHLFTEAILAKKPITLYDKGKLKRDFTYIDDIINGLVGLLNAGYDQETTCFNLGNTNPIEMKTFVSLLEKHLDKKARIENVKAPATEPLETYADISESKARFNFSPKTDIEEGLRIYIKWYKKYYHNI